MRTTKEPKGSNVFWPFAIQSSILASLMCTAVLASANWVTSYSNAEAIAISGICFKIEVRSFTFAFSGTTTRLEPCYGEEATEEV